METQLVERAAIPFHAIPAGGIHGVGPVKAASNALKLLRAFVEIWRYMRSEHPDALLTTGGYISAPLTLAAWLQRIPILVYLPDIEPARSFRLAGRFATRIATTVEASRTFLPAEKVIVTGYPLRKELMHWERSTARRALSLPDEGPVLLVFGGSRGARSINRAVLAHLSELLALAHVVHISGQLDWPEVSAAAEALKEQESRRYHSFPYLYSKEMGAALASADLVLSRAGASTLGEFPYFGLPAILVPYPYAWHYQRVNAQWLAERGAALLVEDADLPQVLMATVQALLQDKERLSQMAGAAQALACPDAASKLAEILINLNRKSKNG